MISQLNKEFESRVRLGIMSVLMVNDWVDFNEMKQLLERNQEGICRQKTKNILPCYTSRKKSFRRTFICTGKITWKVENYTFSLSC